MLIINTLKSFYIDNDSKIIRMGNFKNSAKEIEYEDDTLILLFESIKEPISKEDLIAMEALNRDVLEANINSVDEVKEEKALDPEKEVEETPVEVKEEKKVNKIELSDEFRDLARYFRLSIRSPKKSE